MFRVQRCMALGILVALAAVFGLGAARAQTGGYVGYYQKDAPAVQDKDVGKKVDPVAPQKKYSMKFSNAPWIQVLDWLKNISQLPISTKNVPPGSFTFLPPVDIETGKAKEYTVGEAIDVLNEELLVSKFLIMRRMASIAVWPADEPIPLELVKLISVSDLKNADLAKSEYVRTTVQLQSLQADTFAPGVLKMMSPFGRVIPLEEPNQMILIENVANLRIILDTINKIDSDDAATTYIYKCEYCRAAVAAEKLKDMLGDPERENAKAAMAAKGGGNNPGGAAFGGNIQAPAGFKVKFEKPHAIAYDDRTNQVFITGSPAKLALAKRVLRELDQPEVEPGMKRIEGPPILKTFTVPSGNAEAAAKVLQEIYKSSTTLRITAIGNTQIMVYAPPADQIDIARYIVGSLPDEGKVFVAAIEGEDSQVITDLMVERFGDPTKVGAPLIKNDKTRNAVIIMGTPEQISEVKNAIAAVVGQVNLLGDASGNIRIISLEKGGASTLANMLQKALKETQPKTPVTIINPVEFTPKRVLPDLKKDVPNIKKDIPDDKAKKAELRTRLDRYLTALAAEEQVPFEKKIVQPGKGLPEQSEGVTIAPFGSKLIVTSKDKATLNLISEMVRLFTSTSATPSDFVVIPLMTANASDTAGVLDVLFNGGSVGGKGGGGGGGAAGLFGGGGKGGGGKGGGGKGGGGAAGGGFGGFGGGGAAGDAISSFLGGIGGNPQAAGQIGMGGGIGGAKRVERIRVVAEPTTNNLLVWASPLDIMIIYDLLDKAIDKPPTGDAILQTWWLPPLKYAVATEVAQLICNIYANKMGSAGVKSNITNLTGLAVIQGNSSAPAGGVQPALSVGVDDRTNTIVLHCNTTLKNAIVELIDNVEMASKDATAKVKVITVRNMDPAVVQRALDAIQGKAPTNQAQNAKGQGALGGLGQGGGGGAGGFGGAGGAGGFGGGGVGAGGGAGGFGGGAGGGGAGGGGKGGGGGGKGGGSPRSMPSFFEQGVMDDPGTPVLYDPQRDGYPEFLTTGELPAGFAAQNNHGSKSANSMHAARLITVQVPQPKPQPFESKQLPQPGAEAKPPRLPIYVQPLPELGVVVVRSNNSEDMEEIVKLIKIIQDQADKTEIEVQIIAMEQADSNSVANALNLMYSRVQFQPNATVLTAPVGAAAKGAAAAGGGGAGGQTVQALQPPSGGLSGTLSTTVFVQSLPRFNALLIAAPRSRMEEIKKDIEKFDKASPDTLKIRSFPLVRAVAGRVAAEILNFFNSRYSPVESNQQSLLRVSFDETINTVFVQAAPADMLDVVELIRMIDGGASGAVNDLKVFKLKNAVATDLSNLLKVILEESIVVPAAPGTIPGGAGGAAAGAAITTTTNQPYLGQTGYSYTGIKLRFQGKMTLYDADVLRDMFFNFDVRTNSVIVAAPESTMPLIKALIDELDTPPNYAASVNVFPLKKADALALQNVLLTIITGTTTTGGATAKTATATTTATGASPIGIFGSAPEGAPIIDVRITIDDRSNSIIAAGSPADLEVIRAIIERLDNIQTPRRVTKVVALFNIQAADAVTAVQTFVTNVVAIYNTAGQKTAFLELVRDLVLIAEPVTNKLLLNVAPEYLDEIMGIIQEIDVQPAQVSIECMIAEVKIDGSEEFGCEIGLQTPVLFQRSFTTGATAPTTGAVGYNFGAGGLGILGQNPLFGPNTVGVQGGSNLGVGTTSPTGTGVGGFVFSMSSDTVNVLIRALQTAQRLHVISCPTITATDNQTARILVGQDFPYVTGSISTTVTAGSLPTITNTVAYKDIGVQIQVSAKIAPDGTITMRVIPEVSDATTTTVQVSNGVFATAFDVQTVETTCIVHDGETVCLGGMISTVDSKTENKVPWFGDLPWVGAAFRFRTQTKDKLELVCILTPHVIKNPAHQADNFARQVTKMDWMLPEVAKIYGIQSFEPLLPPPGVGFQNPLPPLQNPDFAPPPRPGPNPGMQPHVIMPQWQIPSAEQTLPPPQVLPQVNMGGPQAMRSNPYDQPMRQY